MFYKNANLRFFYDRRGKMVGMWLFWTQQFFIRKVVVNPQTLVLFPVRTSNLLFKMLDPRIRLYGLCLSDDLFSIIPCVWFCVMPEIFTLTHEILPWWQVYHYGFFENSGDGASNLKLEKGAEVSLSVDEPRRMLNTRYTAFKNYLNPVKLSFSIWI